jgi:aspartyl/asparaginyl beta-hydroxylase (cupin superfamily)
MRPRKYASKATWRAAIRHFFYAFILDAPPMVVPARHHDIMESGEFKWANRQSA